MLKSKETGLSKSWSVVKRQGASYTGGPISVSKDGAVAACMCNDHAALLDVQTGAVLKFLPPEVRAACPVLPASACLIARYLCLQGSDEEPLSAFALSPDGAVLVTCGRNQMLRRWSVADGRCSKAWKGHRAPVSCTAIDPSGTLLATGSSDRGVMIWDLDHGHATHSFRGHAAVVTVVAFVPHAVSVQRLVSGSESGEVRVWDLPTSTAVALLSEHSSAVTAIAFSPDPSGYTMLTAGRDSMINLWDTRDWDAAAAPPASSIAARAQVATRECVEGLVVLPPPSGAAGDDAAVTAAGRAFLFATAGDRGVLRLWRVSIAGRDAATRRYGCGVVAGRTMTQLREQAGADEPALDAAGCAAAVSAPPAGGEDAAPLSDQFAALLLLRAPAAGSDAAAAAGAGARLVAVSRDHVLTVVDGAHLGHCKTIVGFSDEIVDVKYVPAPLAIPADAPPAAARSFAPHASHGQCLLAVATNSEQLRLIDAVTLDSRLCHGHTGVILGLAVSPDGTLVATASKDRTARVWDVATGACVAECVGHTESVTAAAWPARAAHFMHASPVPAAATGAGAAAVLGTQAWLATASKDRTIKLWALGSLLARLPSPRPGPSADGSGPGWTRRAALGSGAALFRPLTSAAVVAHEKDINALAVAPNDALLATGSQDKTVRLWGLPGLAPLATLRGHKRGVWAVAFSSTDRILASASGDRTVRLWNMSPGSGHACLRTLEGHDASVLALCFLRRGTQLMTAGADGLLKLWNVADGECANTFDAHTEKVWALAVRPAGLGGVTADRDEPEIVSGGSDSVLNVWHDVTSTEAASEMLETEAALLKQQRLYGAMALRDYAGAITLALELQQPARIGDILGELLEAGPAPRTAGLTPAEEEARFAAAMRAEVAEMRAELAGAVDGGEASSPGEAVGASSSSSSAQQQQQRQRGAAMLAALLRSLPPADLGRLLGYVREWNTQSRHGLLAQRVLAVLLRTVPHASIAAALLAAKAEAALTRILPGVGAVRVAKAPRAVSAAANSLAPITNGVEDEDADGAGGGGGSGAGAAAAAAEQLKSLVAGLLPYSERHYDRLDRLSVAAYGVDSVLAAMSVLEPLGAEEGSGAAATADLAMIGRGPSGIEHPSAPRIVSDDEDEDEDAEDIAAASVGGGWLTGLAPAALQLAASRAVMKVASESRGMGKQSVRAPLSSVVTSAGGTGSREKQSLPVAVSPVVASAGDSDPAGRSTAASGAKRRRSVRAGQAVSALLTRGSKRV